MTKNHPLLMTLLSTCILGGCASLPRFSGPPGFAGREPAPEGVPRVSEIINHVQCEILHAIAGGGPAATAIGGHHLVVHAHLTMEVKDDGGINPSLSFIHPFVTDGTNRTLGFGAGLQGTTHRTYDQEFTLNLSEPNPAGPTCPAATSRPVSGIQGNLGIDQIIVEGLRHLTPGAYMFSPVRASADDEGPIFGTQIDFTAVYGLSADPTWTLTHFEGPSGGSPSLLNYTRTHTETLILSFAEATPPSPPANTRGNENLLNLYNLSPHTPDVGAAARAARDNTLRMILLRRFGGR